MDVHYSTAVYHQQCPPDVSRSEIACEIVKFRNFGFLTHPFRFDHVDLSSILRLPRFLSGIFSVIILIMSNERCMSMFKMSQRDTMIQFLNFSISLIQDESERHTVLYSTEIWRIEKDIVSQQNVEFFRLCVKNNIHTVHNLWPLTVLYCTVQVKLL